MRRLVRRMRSGLMSKRKMMRLRSRRSPRLRGSSARMSAMCSRVRTMSMSLRVDCGVLPRWSMLLRKVTESVDGGTRFGGFGL